MFLWHLYDFSATVLLINIIFNLNGTKSHMASQMLHLERLTLFFSFQWWKSHNVTAAFVRFLWYTPSALKDLFWYLKNLFLNRIFLYGKFFSLVSYFLLPLIDFDISWKMWRIWGYYCEKLLNPLLTFCQGYENTFIAGASSVGVAHSLMDFFFNLIKTFSNFHQISISFPDFDFSWKFFRYKILLVTPRLLCQLKLSSNIFFWL